MVAHPENFPHVNDYRNSVVAEMMKNLNYVNMFNHGVSEVQDLLKENQSPVAEFNVNLVTAFSVIAREPEAVENMQKVAKTGQKVELSQVCPKLSQVCPKLSQVQLTKSSIALIALSESRSLPISALMEKAGVVSRGQVHDSSTQILISQIIDNQRAEYGKQVIKNLSLKLVERYGSGWSEKKLRHCIRSAETL